MLRRFALLAAFALGTSLVQAVIVDGTGVEGPASLTISNAIYQSEDVTVKNGGHLTIEAGAIFGSDWFSSWVYALDSSTVTINGGTFGSVFGGVYAFDSSTLTINGGTFGGGVVASHSSTLTINGGTFEYAVASESSTMTINGGTFGYVGTSGSSTVTINGGTFGRILDALAAFGTGTGTLTFRASSFDTASYPLGDSQGVLGVTFCSQAPQSFRIESVWGFLDSVVLQTIVCDSDSDGVPDGVDQCPNSVELGSTIKIGSCDTGVPNPLFASGCTLSDEIAQIAASSQSHDEFVSGVSLLSNNLRKSGVLTKDQRLAILNCAARFSLP